MAGAAAAPVLTPRDARAQPGDMPVVGFLHPGFQAGTPNVDGFRRGLRDAGFVEGQNVAITYRWGEGHYERMPALAADLVASSVAVIAVGGGIGPILAVKTATAKVTATAAIPVVFFTGTDPVEDGLVASFGHPEANLTGAFVLVNVLVAKQLQILHELVPAATKFAVIDNAAGPASIVRMRELHDGARALGVELQILDASADSDLDAAFAKIIAQRPGGLVISPDPFLTARREQLAALAVRHKIPTIAAFREFTAAGCLMSYGTDLPDGYRLVGDYCARILKGARPADLPVQQSTKVEFVINLKTAKALGLSFPITLLGRADEVIE